MHDRAGHCIPYNKVLKHVVLLTCNGACSINQIKKKTSTHYTHTTYTHHTHTHTTLTTLNSRAHHTLIPHTHTHTTLLFGPQLPQI